MLIPLNRKDALYIAFHMREDDAREVMATRGDNYRHSFAEDCLRFGGWCYRDKDGVPVAMGGIVRMWRGVGTAWMVATPAIARHGVAVSRHCYRQMMIDSEGLHRVHAFSAAFHTISHQWLEMLGFTRGATLRGWGKQGEDFILFERIS